MITVNTCIGLHASVYSYLVITPAFLKLDLHLFLSSQEHMQHHNLKLTFN